MTQTNQNGLHEEIKGRLYLWNAHYHSVHSLLSSFLQLKYMKIKIYRTIILPLGIWVYNLVHQFEGRTWTEGVSVYDGEEWA
jgi:hypothetical protein